MVTPQKDHPLGLRPTMNAKLQRSAYCTPIEDRTAIKPEPEAPVLKPSKQKELKLATRITAGAGDLHRHAYYFLPWAITESHVSVHLPRAEVSSLRLPFRVSRPRSEYLPLMFCLDQEMWRDNIISHFINFSDLGELGGVINFDKITDYNFLK